MIVWLSEEYLWIPPCYASRFFPSPEIKFFFPRCDLQTATQRLPLLLPNQSESGFQLLPGSSIDHVLSHEVRIYWSFWGGCKAPRCAEVCISNFGNLFIIAINRYFGLPDWEKKDQLVYCCSGLLIKVFKKGWIERLSLGSKFFFQFCKLGQMYGYGIHLVFVGVMLNYGLKMIFNGIFLKYKGIIWNPSKINILL